MDMPGFRNAIAYIKQFEILKVMNFKKYFFHIDFNFFQFWNLKIDFSWDFVDNIPLAAEKFDVRNILHLAGLASLSLNPNQCNYRAILNTILLQIE